MRKVSATLVYEVAAVRLNTAACLQQRSWTGGGQVSGTWTFGEQATDPLQSLALRQHRAKQPERAVRGLKSYFRFSSWLLLDAEDGGTGCFPGGCFVGAEKLKLQVRNMMALGT